MGGGTDVTVSAFSADDAARHLAALGALLHACVHDGASIGFVLPYGEDEAAAFWRTHVLPPLRAGGRVLLVAWCGGHIAGSGQLDHDTLPNQAHRAEISKLMVHPAFRRRGIGRVLMAALEREARGRGRSLITLDTRTGDDAERLYTALGYRTAGVLPGWARAPAEDRLEATTFMYKVL